MRVVLGLVNGSEAPRAPGFMVVEVADVDSESLISLVGGESTETLVSHEVGRKKKTVTKEDRLTFSSGL